MRLFSRQAVSILLVCAAAVSTRPEAFGRDGADGPGRRGGVLLLEVVQLGGAVASSYQTVSLVGGKAVWDFGKISGEVTFLGKDGCIYLDRNGNGRVDPGDGKPLADGAVLKGSFEFRGKEYPYSVRFSSIGSEYFALRSLTALRARWGSFLVYFLDNDMDGRFFRFGVDRVGVVKIPGGGKRAGGVGRDFVSSMLYLRSQPLSHVIRLGERLYFLLPRKEGEDPRILPFPGRTVSLRVGGGKGDRAKMDLLLADPARDFYFRIPGPGTFPMPAGKYWIQDFSVSLSWKRKPGSSLRRPDVSILRGPTWAGQIRVDLGKDSFFLDPGPPYRLDFDGIVWGKKGERLEISAVHLVSPSGLKLQAEVFERGGGRSTIKAYLRSGERRRFLSNLEYG